MSVRRRADDAFNRLPPSVRRPVLHGLGRYAPWEPEFDFTPPTPGPGERAGPPEFVGVGVQKSGTTWWYELVASHPDVWSPPGIHKERHFFDRFAAEPFVPLDAERYQGWFPRPDGMVCGEWTPDYFTQPWVPPLLQRAAPEARLLILLRDPVERFRSGIAHDKRMGTWRGTPSSADAVQRGFYFRALTSWLEYFHPDQILVLQYERCVLDPVGQYRATTQFLDLGDFDPPALEQPGRVPSSTAAGLAAEVRQRLQAAYESDVKSLATLVPDLDLSLWPNFTSLADVQSNSPTPRT